MNQTTLTLNNGVVIPQFGLGVYSIPDGEITYNSVLAALRAGYRHIDTAHAYGNERSVGRAIKDSGIPRDSIWVTSKLWPNEYGEILRDPVINEIAKSHGKSAAQVIIRWHIQKGFSVVPGSSNPKHIQVNIEVFDFELSPEEMAKMASLNQEKRYFTMNYQQIKAWMENYELWD